MATYFYVDGLNFYYGAVRGGPHRWVDFEALCQSLVPRDTIGMIRYFTALVRPQYRGDRAPERQNVYLRAIDANPLLDVHRGHFTSEPRWRALAEHKFKVRDLFRPTLRPNLVVRTILAEARRRRMESDTLARVIVLEEKRSDVSLAAHVVYDAVTKACDKAIVITNDSDLMEPILLAKAARIPIGLVNPHPCPTNRRLRDAADFEIPFRREILARCQLPNTVRAKNGKELHRPKEWR